MTDTLTADLPPAGWYDDPAGSVQLRWWGGIAWTNDLIERPVAVQTQYVADSTPSYAHVDYDRYREFEAGPSTTTGSTGAIWLIAVFPLISAILQYLGGVTGWNQTPLGVIMPWLVAVVCLVLFVLADGAALRRLGVQAPSAAWILLLPPIGYLLARRSALVKQGIRSNTPGLVYFLSVLAAVAVVMSMIVPMQRVQDEKAAMASLESELLASLTAGGTWTVVCPDHVDTTQVGLTFTCTAADDTGTSAIFSVRVVGPFQFELTGADATGPSLG